LYFTNYFRKSTFAIPTENDEKSVAYALQRLFYHMQIMEHAVGTNELTKSFGWDTMDAFHQHDVQELNRVLQDNLEKVMKGTPAEGAIKKLFTGKMKSYIKCINVDYESSRVEEYYDIQLNVKGNKNLYESFVDYCQVETLDGDNKYFAEGFGLQDAKKGVIFESFPPVLHLQLKRFDYDMERDMFVKINDRHEFGMEISLDDFLHPGADRSIKQHYRLQAVLVHSGDLNAGHYFALIRPKRTGPWFRFDDDKVIPVTEHQVLNDNFGGEVAASTPTAPPKRPARFFTNAYMLVYVRLSDEEEVLGDISDDDIPQHLKERLKKEMEEAERKVKEMQERHLYCRVLYRTSADLEEHDGVDLGFQSCLQNLTLLKELTLKQVYEAFAKELKLEPTQMRIWNAIMRQNKTIRIENVIVPSETVTLLELQKQLTKGESDLRFFIELGDFEEITPNNVLIFLKQYSPEFKRSRIVGTKTFEKSEKVGAIIDVVQSIVENARIYEEIKPNMVDDLDETKTFEECELIHGDIIIFEPRTGQGPFGTVEGYFDFLLNQIEMTFRNTKGQEFKQIASLKMTYADIVQLISEVTNHDPRKIRLFQVASSGQFRNPIKQHSMTLKDMLGYAGNPILGFDLLTMDLAELETKRVLKVTTIEGDKSALVPKTGTVADLLSILGLQNVRVFESLNARMARQFQPEDPISTLNEYANLFCLVFLY
jgi:ubiquitin carboxyl-terminal hydrolase 7